MSRGLGDVYKRQSYANIAIERFQQFAKLDKSDERPDGGLRSDDIIKVLTGLFIEVLNTRPPAPDGWIYASKKLPKDYMPRLCITRGTAQGYDGQSYEVLHFDIKNKFWCEHDPSCCILEFRKPIDWREVIFWRELPTAPHAREGGIDDCRFSRIMGES